MKSCTGGCNLTQDCELSHANLPRIPFPPPTFCMHMRLAYETMPSLCTQCTIAVWQMQVVNTYVCSQLCFAKTLEEKQIQVLFMRMRLRAEQTEQESRDSSFKTLRLRYVDLCIVYALYTKAATFYFMCSLPLPLYCLDLHSSKQVSISERRKASVVPAAENCTKWRRWKKENERWGAKTQVDFLRKHMYIYIYAF